MNWKCGPMPNVTAALPNIGGALCSTTHSLADAHCWSKPKFRWVDLVADQVSDKYQLRDLVSDRKSLRPGPRPGRRQKKSETRSAT